MVSVCGTMYLDDATFVAGGFDGFVGPVRVVGNQAGRVSQDIRCAAVIDWQRDFLGNQRLRKRKEAIPCRLDLFVVRCFTIFRLYTRCSVTRDKSHENVTAAVKAHSQNMAIVYFLQHILEDIGIVTSMHHFIKIFLHLF